MNCSNTSRQTLSLQWHKIIYFKCIYASPSSFTLNHNIFLFSPITVIVICFQCFSDRNVSNNNNISKVSERPKHGHAFLSPCENAHVFTAPVYTRSRHAARPHFDGKQITCQVLNQWNHWVLFTVHKSISDRETARCFGGQSNPDSESLETASVCTSLLAD